MGGGQRLDDPEVVDGSTLKATLSSRSGTGVPAPEEEGMSQRGQDFQNEDTC